MLETRRTENWMMFWKQEQVPSMNEKGHHFGYIRCEERSTEEQRIGLINEICYYLNEAGLPVSARLQLNPNENDLVLMMFYCDVEDADKLLASLDEVKGHISEEYQKWLEVPKEKNKEGKALPRTMTWNWKWKTDKEAQRETFKSHYDNKYV